MSGFSRWWEPCIEAECGRTATRDGRCEPCWHAMYRELARRKRRRDGIPMRPPKKVRAETRGTAA
jgi:hypothetical protein